MIAAFGTFEDPLGDRYRFEAEIGRGGMGTVYRAMDLRLSRRVAIKMLHPTLTNEVGVARFESEIRIAAGLQHSHIVAIHDSGEAAGRLYFVMDYLGGETLRARITRERQMGVEDSIAIVEDVASALQYAHNHGVVHRDVKPENILLGDEGHACVVDFGLARALGSVDADRLTASGLAVGTPHYLSPEQAAAERDVGPKSDQYALACVLYEMLAGEPPFTGPTASAIAIQHLASKPVPLRHRRPTVPSNVDAAVMRAMEKVPTDRWPSAHDFVSALRSPQASPLLLAPNRTKRRIAAAGLVITLGAALLMVTQSGSAGERVRLRDRVSAWLSVAPEVNPNLVAVAPFTIVGADTMWREGFVDVMSRIFDGAGPLRAVSAREVLHKTANVRDATTALSLGRATRAGLVVFGRLTSVGTDSLRLRATLLDVRTTVAVGDVDLTEHASQVDRLADSACVRLLRDLGATRPIGAVRTTSIGSRSMPALKAFLRGEQMYRRNEWAKAETLYQQSIRDDERFAIALHRLRSVLRGTRGEDDLPSFRYALLAGQWNHGLSPRDSLLIVADSIYAAMALSPPATHWWAMLRRRVAILRQLSDAYPRDPEVWLELGETLHHNREWIGVDRREALQAFVNSIQQDSAFAPAYFHAIELGFRYLPLSETQRLVERYLAQNPSDVPVRLLRDLLSRDTEVSTRAWARVDSLDAMTVFNAAYLVRFMPDSGEMSVRLFRALDRGNHFRSLSHADSMRVERWRFRSMVIRGHYREAYAHTGETLGEWGPAEYVQLGLLGAIPADRVQRVLGGWMDTASVARIANALPWWMANGDSAALLQARGRLLRVAGARTTPTATFDLTPYAVAIIDADLALLRGDTIGALRGFAVVPDSLCGAACTTDRIQRATVLRTVGRAGDARVLLESHLTSDIGSVHEMLWVEARAEAAQASGATEIAARDRAYLTQAWRRADSRERTIARVSSRAPPVPLARRNVRARAE